MNLNLNWSKGKKQSDGRLLRTAKPTQEFWALWKVKKTAIKKAGYTISKIDGDWLATQTVDDNAAIEQSVATASEMEIPAPAGLAYLPFQKAGIAYACRRKTPLLATRWAWVKPFRQSGRSMSQIQAPS